MFIPAEMMRELLSNSKLKAMMLCDLACVEMKNKTKERERGGREEERREGRGERERGGEGRDRFEKPQNYLSTFFFFFKTIQHKL